MACSYLSKSSFECTLTKGGIFVPVQSHFENFCLTDYFMQCDHYMKFADVNSDDEIGAPGTKKAYDHGRRRFLRHTGRFPLEFLLCDDNGGYSPGFKGAAYTVDFGQGGMRVVSSSKEIFRDGFMIFNFSKDFIVPYLHGLAEVCWQRPDIVDNQWQAGLAFKDHSVKALIAIQMGSL